MLGLDIRPHRRGAVELVRRVPRRGGRTVGTYWAPVGMSIAAAGLYGTKGMFWSMPPMFLTGIAAATGIAWTNSIGNLGSFFGPSIVGWVKDQTGSFAGGLYALAGFALMSAVVAALWLHIPRRTVAAPRLGVAAEYPASPARGRRL